MPSRKYRLDRFLAAHTSHSRGHVRYLIAQNKVLINDQLASVASEVIDHFTKVECEGVILQDKKPVYLMLNKPVGVVSATKDSLHTTVVDILPDAYDDLHIAGRLDLNSSGLLLLTNHGEWSRNIAAPEAKVSKRYKVKLEKPLTDEYISAFKEGMYFSYEDITTRPAGIELVDSHTALVSLKEGRYHQIKRMFGRFRNPVLSLERLSIGELHLDPSLAPGESRKLTKSEVELFL